MPQRAQVEFSTQYARATASFDVRRCFVWAHGLAIVGLIASTDPCAAETKIASSIVFHIPAQSLNSALSRYGDLTGREALYDASLTDGKLSSDVVGSFSPDEALNRLLSTSGLVPEFIDKKQFVLLPAPKRALRPDRKERSQQHWRYYGLTQLGVLASLCASRDARPGYYRVVVMIWIASDGTVAKAVRIGSTGGVELDHKFDAALRNARVNEPPPAGFLSPVLLLIVPEESGMTVCDSISATPGSLGIGR